MKKIFICLLFVLTVLASIACVSAVDVDNATSQTVVNVDDAGSNLVLDNNVDNDENLSVQTDTNVSGADSARYSDLAEEIRQSGHITLKHKNYTYDKGANPIYIGESKKVIDGNGAVIDMAGSTIRAFTVTTSGVTIKNLTIKNANFHDNGGAIFFSKSGTVTNCNFTNNFASSQGGAASFGYGSGSVDNCNFNNNSAKEGVLSGYRLMVVCQIVILLAIMQQSVLQFTPSLQQTL